MRNRSEWAWSESGRMYWNLRNRLGQFVTLAGFNRSRREEQHARWREYLESRRNAAESATNGHMVKRAARTLGRTVNVDRFFTPGASLRNASDELREWFEINKSTLSFAQFCAQY